MSELLFREQVDLKQFSTLGIGGPARYFLEIDSISKMQQALYYCSSNQIPYIVLGKGSNCLFDDRGFNGAILLNKIDFFHQKMPGSFYVGAGYSFALLGVQTARQGWSGLEFASGIPASIGGAIWMNAGANGQETCHCLDSVEFVNNCGIQEVYQRQDLLFSYRHSPFQEKLGAIVAATFSLKKDEEARKVQIEIVNRRKKTQPYSAKSAGCIFLNPEGNQAGTLIDQCGLKGTAIGGAEVSSLHANFLINACNASCVEMVDLICLVKQQVKKTSGIELQSEVRRIPYDLEV
jgi:UDP-N-acetylmuramate dehydrogenase